MWAVGAEYQFTFKNGQLPSPGTRLNNCLSFNRINPWEKALLFLCWVKLQHCNCLQYIHVYSNDNYCLLIILRCKEQWVTVLLCTCILVNFGSSMTMIRVHKMDDWMHPRISSFVCLLPPFTIRLPHTLTKLAICYYCILHFWLLHVVPGLSSQFLPNILLLRSPLVSNTCILGKYYMIL